MYEYEDVPIKALASLVTIGRLKISPDKGTPLMERIEFPNQVDPLTNTFYPALSLIRTSGRVPHGARLSFAHT